MQAFSLVAVHRLLIVVASLVAEHRLYMRTLVAMACGLVVTCGL